MVSVRDVDQQYVWHPFTQMREWCDPGYDITVITGGKGAWLFDDKGRKYLDGNSSIWTNLHGHREPRLDAALRRQLGRIAHSSFLGLTNDLAPRLAQRLVQALRSPRMRYRVFFSDDGSTAIETALKMAAQARLQRGEPKRKRFVCLTGGYHGDTTGAMSLGHSPQFHRPFEHLLFETVPVEGPHCYRCPHNRSKPTRNRDQRAGRRCAWECMERLEQVLGDRSETICALVMEPRVQGAAGMWMHPPGYLRGASKLCRKHGIWLLLDEVLTGMGRTGEFLACQKEGVRPDFIALAKGLSGGYLPLAATIVSGEIFEAFLGEYSEFKTFFHGHSYTGNALGCAAALASLDLLAGRHSPTTLRRKAEWLRADTARFWEHPNVGDVRQEGMICAIELVEDRESRKPLSASRRIGYQVCRAAARHGLLTRPIGDVLVLMPPYCVSRREVRAMAGALWRALTDILPRGAEHDGD